MKDEALKVALSCIRSSAEYKRGNASFIEAAEDVEQALAAPVQPVAILKGIDEYGPVVDWCKHWVTVPIGTKFYTTPPAQPAPVQPNIKSYLEKDNSQPVKFSDYEPDGMRHNKPSAAPVQATMKLESSGPGYGPAPKQKLSVRHVSLIDEDKTVAQLVVPDVLNPKYENPAYAAGWNDCRAEMLKERNNG
jgi:hypothetical protein